MDAEETKSHISRVTRGNLNQHQISFIERQNNCTLCGTQLDLNVEPYYNEGLAREEAYCPNCNVKTRIKNHPLQ